MGGVICERCSKKDEEEKVNEETELNKEENISPRISMQPENQEKTKKEEAITKSIKLKSGKVNIKEKRDEKKTIFSSRTTKDRDLIQNQNGIIEFDEKDLFKENNDDNNSKKKLKKENKIILNFDNIEIDKKNGPKQQRFARRKKKSSTVKQNQFFFNQLFSAELCVPISQEKLIWENRGYQKNNYKRGNLIGKGAFGYVYESINPIFDNKIAMKIIDKNKMNINDNNNILNEEKEDMKSEINILKKLSHPNIVKIFEFYETDNYFYIITEFCKSGELSKYINNNNLTESQLCVIFYQVFSGLMYLHENHIIHGDLKPQNILISSKENNSV